MNIYTDKPMSDPFPEDKRIDYPRFQNVIYPVIKGDSKLGPHVIWDQVKLYIKGSAEAIMQHHDLTKEQYCDEKHFPARRIKLSAEERLDAYSLYVRYNAYQKTDHLWDDCDKVNGVSFQPQRKLSRQLSRQSSNHSNHSTQSLSRSNSTLSRQSSFTPSPLGPDGGAHLSPLPSQHSLRSRSHSGTLSIPGIEESPTEHADGHHELHRQPSHHPELQRQQSHHPDQLQRQSSQHHSPLERHASSHISSPHVTEEPHLHPAEETCWTGLFELLGMSNK